MQNNATHLIRQSSFLEKNELPQAGFKPMTLHARVLTCYMQSCHDPSSG